MIPDGNMHCGQCVCVCMPGIHDTAPAMFYGGAFDVAVTWGLPSPLLLGAHVAGATTGHPRGTAPQRRLLVGMGLMMTMMMTTVYLLPNVSDPNYLISSCMIE